MRKYIKEKIKYLLLFVVSIFDNEDSQNQIDFINKFDSRQIIYINPNYIEKIFLKEPYQESQSHKLFIFKWKSKDLENLENSRIMIKVTLHDIFIEGKDYRMTPQYFQMVERITNKERPLYNCKTYEDIDLYFVKLIASFENIKKYGFKTQKELKEDSLLFSKLSDELFVFIGSQGELIFGGGGGNHRLIISKILNLEMIPVLISGIHKDFLLTKSKKHNNKNLFKIIKMIINDANLKNR